MALHSKRALLRRSMFGLALGGLTAGCGDGAPALCSNAECPALPLPAPGPVENTEPSGDLSASSEEALPQPATAAAFIDIEAVAYEAALGAQRSQPARLFYSLFPATQDAKERPLFVFFNGGPGYNTSAELHAFGTGPMTVPVAPPRATAVPNPDSFDQLGSLLYIDARNTGFSHLVTDDPSQDAQRLAGVTHASQNPWLDAADFARVILRVLEQNPALRNNRVVLVGESYGATRAALLSSLLFAPQRLESAAPDELVPYVDPALSAELQAHYAAVFPEVAFADLTPEVISQQFGAQVLVQPAFGMAASEPYIPDAVYTDCTPGAPMTRAAELLGTSCPPPFGSFDVNHPAMPDGFMAQVLEAGMQSMLYPAGFELRFQVHPSEVMGLAAAQRPGAFRFGQLSRAQSRALLESPEWNAQLGELPEWDRYFLQTFPESGGFNGDLELLRVGFRLFLRQLPWIKTLITDGFFDLDVPSRDLLRVLEEWRGQGLDLSASYDGAVRSTELRPGWLQFEYGPGIEVPDARRRPLVRMPLYLNSAHMITVNEGAELMHDVRDFFFSTPAGGG